MPEQELEVEGVKRRTTLLRDIFPTLSQSDAVLLDKAVVNATGSLLDDVLSLPAPEGVDEKQFHASVILYIKSNVDEAVKILLNAE